LNWDFYLGQAPKVDYVKERCHTTFRYWLDYSGGTMTDWGAHHNDIARWAIGLEGPTEIEARVLANPSLVVTRQSAITKSPSPMPMGQADRQVHEGRQHLRRRGEQGRPAERLKFEGSRAGSG